MAQWSAVAVAAMAQHDRALLRLPLALRRRSACGRRSPICFFYLLLLRRQRRRRNPSCFVFDASDEALAAGADGPWR